MQNNVTELTQKLLRSLDSNYNVVDMPAVLEVLSKLEKISLSKDVLEATRVGRHINLLRKNTANKVIAKRTKLLVKKWRDLFLPETNNGQLKPVESSQQLSRTTTPTPSTEDASSRKRPAKEPLLENSNAKRIRLNGGPNNNEHELSDNSNSSFKDSLLATSKLPVPGNKPVAVVAPINTDSNSSFQDVQQESNVAPSVEQPLPKKRGRKKGSKNHKNLVEEAETSFSNKLNVSRGNAKVKTTQELLADLHIRNSSIGTGNAAKPLDLNERAAKLTERVSIIDQKLNANSNRYKNFQKRLSYNNKHISGHAPADKSNQESGVVVNSKLEDDVIIVDDLDPEPVPSPDTNETDDNEAVKDTNIPKSLSVEEALALLPPIDFSCLTEKDPEPRCTCRLIENKSDFTVDFSEEVNDQRTFEFCEDECCPAKAYLNDKYRLNECETDRSINSLHFSNVSNFNGNEGVGCCSKRTELTENGLYVNVVPNVYTESLSRFSDANENERPASENFKKYSISEENGDCNSNDLECETSVAKNSEEENPHENRELDGVSDTKRTFSEWYEVYDTPSYNGQVLRILPYVIID